jgi:FMN-dependent NADH-azoreductase
MSIVLVINASARNERSISRAMSKAFVEHWQTKRPSDAIVYRDVGMNPPPMLSEAWMAAAFTPDDQQTPAHKQALAYSDEVIDELERTDLIVMAAPRYNYGMPATLKAWFDQVIRVRRTFSFDRNEKTWPLTPLLRGKTLVVLTASGEFDFHKGGIREHWNHLDPHIRTCAHYIGVAAEDIYQVVVEYQEFGDERHEKSVADAHRQIQALVERLAPTLQEAPAMRGSLSSTNPVVSSPARRGTPSKRRSTAALRL